MERHDPEVRADELTSLQQFLDLYRATALRKVEGLDRLQLAQTTGDSSLSLGGILKHLALVEDAWFQADLLGRPIPAPFTDIDWDADPDWEFRTAADDEPEILVGLYEAACERSRGAVAEVGGDLDTLSVAESRNGYGKFSLRWIMLHMIEETARHCGHMDLIRESIDGATGD